MLLEEIDYAYHHKDNPPERPQYKRFIEYIYELEKNEAGFALAREFEDTRFWSYFTLNGTKVPGITHTLSLGINFPPTLPAEVSYPTMMLTAWAIAAAHVEEYDHFLFNILLGGRDAEFTGIDRLMRPVSTTAPLATSINRDSTFRKNVKFVQKRIDEAGSVQHLVRLDDKLHRLLTSAPVVVVHPADDYEEAAIKHLGLFRSRVEMVQRLVDAMFMNFCLRPGNAEVDLIMTFDFSFFPENKAVRYLGYLKQVFMRVFTLEGLNLTIEEMNLDYITPTSSVFINIEIV